MPSSCGTRRNNRRNRRNNRKNGGGSSGFAPGMLGGGSSRFAPNMLGGGGGKIGGKIPAVGKKAQVWHGTARHTSGGLTKKDLMKTKNGRIVSRRKHAAGKKAITKLRKLGYVAKKGTFKLFSKKHGGSSSLAGILGSVGP